MEHAVRAPRAGVVQGLAAAVGAQVQEGDLLAVVAVACEEAESKEEGEGAPNGVKAGTRAGAASAAA